MAVAVAAESAKPVVSKKVKPIFAVGKEVAVIYPIFGEKVVMFEGKITRILSVEGRSSYLYHLEDKKGRYDLVWEKYLVPIEEVPKEEFKTDDHPDVKNKVVDYWKG